MACAASVIIARGGDAGDKCARSRRRGSVKKPVNKVAVGLWVLAVIVLIGGAGSLEALREGLGTSVEEGGKIFMVAGNPWKIIVGSLLPAAQLLAFGVIIGLIDQIRWNALHGKA
jgi:hypothetical protein